MKHLTSFMRKAVLALAALSLVPMAVQAQNKALMQRFTNTSCGPCATIAPTYKQFLNENKDKIVHLVYHMSWPSNQDPFYVNDTQLANAVRAEYSVNSVPYVVFNGVQTPNPGSNPAMATALTTVLGQMTNPAQLTVQYTRGTGNARNVSVSVKAGAALNNARLRVVVVEKSRDYNAANGEDVFINIVRQALPDYAGTALSLAAGATGNYNFTFTPKADWLAGGDDLYIVAYVQDAGNKQVYGTTELVPPSGANVTGLEGVIKIPASNTTVRKATVTNPTNGSLNITLQNASSAPQGWNVTAEPSSFTLGAGESREVNVSVVANDQAGFALVSILPEISGSNQIYQANASSMYAISDNIKYAVYAGYSNAIGAYALPILRDAQYGKNTAVLPFNTEFQNVVPITDHDLAVFAFDWDGRGGLAVNAPIVAGIQEMLRLGKSVFAAGQVEIAICQQEATAVGRNLFNSIGVGFEAPVMRITTNSQGQLTGFLTYPINGRSGDPISNAFNATGNTQTDSAFTIYTDIVRPTPGSNSTAMLFFDGNPQRPGGIRYENGRARMVYLGFNMEAIPSTPRNTLYMNAIRWLLDKPAAPPIIAFSDFFVDMEAQATKSITKNVAITNNGDQDLVISGVELTGDNAFTVSSTFPMTITKGQSADLSVVFSPAAENTYTAELKVLSNASNSDESTLFLTGVGTPFTGAGPVIALGSEVLDFEVLDLDVAPSRQRSVKISNTGTGVLRIQNITINGSGRDAYSFTGTLPLEVEAGQDAFLPFTFAPTAKGTYEATVSFGSNADNNITLAVSGRADRSTSVMENGVLRGKTVQVAVAPNPIATQGRVTFGLANAANVRVELVNSLGVVVRTLHNGPAMAGSNTVVLASEGISAGMYRVVVTTPSETLALPVVITK